MRRSIGKSMAGVRQRIEAWRQRRRKRGAMPRSLWAAAVRIARTEGVYTTARALRIDFGALRERVEQAAASPEEPPAGFIELKPQMPAASGTELEFTATTGAKMAIRLAGRETPNLTELIHDFWRLHAHRRGR